MKLFSVLLFITGLGLGAWGLWLTLTPQEGPARDEVSIVRTELPTEAPTIVRTLPDDPPVTGSPGPITGTPAPGASPAGLGSGASDPDAGDQPTGAAPVVPSSSTPVVGSVRQTKPERNVLDNLRTAPIAYEKPSQVQVRTPFEVTLAIDLTDAEAARDALPGTGDVVEAEAQVSSITSATLTGTGFDIVARSPAKQTLSSLTTNRWQWQVTALEDGEHELVVEVFAHVDDVAMPVRTYRDRVTVEVSGVNRVLGWAADADPVIAVIGGLGSMLAGLFGMARFFGRRRAG